MTGRLKERVGEQYDSATNTQEPLADDKELYVGVNMVLLVRGA
jgi:hypothetical protein